MKQIGEILRDMSWPDKLIELACRVRRLSPDRMDPEQFVVEKHSIGEQLEDMARAGR